VGHKPEWDSFGFLVTLNTFTFCAVDEEEVGTEKEDEEFAAADVGDDAPDVDCMMLLVRLSEVPAIGVTDIVLLARLNNGRAPIFTVGTAVGVGILDFDDDREGADEDDFRVGLLEVLRDFFTFKFPSSSSSSSLSSSASSSSSSSPLSSAGLVAEDPDEDVED
jgi:hypothetical protein